MWHWQEYRQAHLTYNRIWFPVDPSWLVIARFHLPKSLSFPMSSSLGEGHSAKDIFIVFCFFFSRYGFFTLPDSAHPTVCAYLLVSCDLGLPFASCETMPGYETSHFTPRAPMMFTFVKAPKAVKLASHEPMLTLAVTTLPLSLVLGWAKL